MMMRIVDTKTSESLCTGEGEGEEGRRFELHKA